MKKKNKKKATKPVSKIKKAETEKRLGGFFRYTIDDDGNMIIKKE